MHEIMQMQRWLFGGAPVRRAMRRVPPRFSWA